METTTNAPTKTGRFSIARFESCMMSSKTSFEQLKNLTGYDVKEITSKNNIPMDLLNNCCLIMNCDPDYIMMLNNDPKIGSFNKPSYHKERRKLSNPLIKDRVSSLIKNEGMTNFVFVNMIGMANYSVYTILNKRWLYEDTVQRIAWVLATSVDYITGKADIWYENPVTSKTPASCNFKIDGSKIDKELLLQNRCGLSPALIDWLCSNTRMIPKALVIKIADAIDKKTVDLKGSDKIPNKDEPLNNSGLRVPVTTKPDTSNYANYFKNLELKIEEMFNSNEDQVKDITYKYLQSRNFTINEMFTNINTFIGIRDDTGQRIKTRIINMIVSRYGLRINHINSINTEYCNFKLIDEELFNKQFKDYDASTFKGLSTGKDSRVIKTAKTSTTKKTKEVEKVTTKPISACDVMNYCNVLTDDDLDIVVRYISALKDLRKVYREGEKK